MILGKSAGSFLYYFLPIRKNVVRTNINIAFPNLTKSKQNLLIKNVYKHYGLMLSEFLRQKSMNINSEIYIIDKETERILQNKENYIIMTAHIGNWEMFIPIMSKYKKMMAVVRIQSNRGGDKFVKYLRTFDKISLIPNKNATRQMLKGLKNNESLLLASDQNAKKKGKYIDFFNKPASIPIGAAYFHHKTKTKILIGFCTLNKSLKYDFKLKEINIEKNNEQLEDIIIELNTTYSKLLENEIKKFPEQYFWFHKKWDKEVYK